MRKSIQKKHSAFSLVESLVALALFGLVLLMMSPLIMGRSNRTPEVHCINGGTKTIIEEDGEYKFSYGDKEGISKLFVTVVQPGTSGDLPSASKYPVAYRMGTEAGTTYEPYYKTIDLLNYSPKYDTLKIVYHDSPLSADIKLCVGGKDCETISTGKFKVLGLSVEEDLYYPDASTTHKEQTARGSTLRAGIPNYGTYLGPIYGVGGRGTYRRIPEKAEYVKQYLRARMVFIEWPADCTITEDVDK